MTPEIRLSYLSTSKFGTAATREGPGYSVADSKRKTPARPCLWSPRTIERIREMQQRLCRGELIRHPGDSQLSGHGTPYTEEGYLARYGV